MKQSVALISLNGIMQRMKKRMIEDSTVAGTMLQIGIIVVSPGNRRAFESHTESADCPNGQQKVCRQMRHK